MSKVDEYRRKRARRLWKRMDADEDGGRWVTTENDNRVHLNKNGVPDKGNPFVVAAMTGKKPKLSMNYHQKNIAGAIKTGDADEVCKELEKLPNGSKILLDGKKYKAKFGDWDGYRFVQFENEEDEDEAYSEYGMADELIQNGDVSVEAPDRGEKEVNENPATIDPEDEENIEDLSETGLAYEPDIEPEDDDFIEPDDDISFEDPEMPNDVGNNGEYASQESGLSDGFTTQSFVDKINEIKENNPSETGLYLPFDAEPIKQMLEQAPVGSVIKSEKNGWEYTKQPNGEWKDVDVGVQPTHGVALNILNSGVASYEPGQEATQSGVANSIPSKEELNDIINSLSVSKEKWSYSDSEVKPVMDVLGNIPAGTEIKSKNGVWSFKKNGNDSWSESDGGDFSDNFVATQLAKYSVGSVSYKGQKIESVKSGNSGISLTQKDFEDKINEIKTTTQPDVGGGYNYTQAEPITEMLDNAPVGSVIKYHMGSFDYEYTKKPNGEWEEKDVGVQETPYLSANLLDNGVISFESGDGGTESNSAGASQTASNSNSVTNPQTASKPHLAGIKVKGSGTVQSVKSEIDDFVDKVKNNDPVSTYQLGETLETLEDGSTIKIGNTTYTKNTDEYGDVEFKFKDNWGDDDWVSKSGLANKISDAAQKFDVPKIELSSPDESGYSGASGGSSVDYSVSNSSSSSSSNVNLYAPKKSDSISFAENDFTQDRKDNAMWDKSGGGEFDSLMRSVTGDVWKSSDSATKDALYNYTTSSETGNFHEINTALRDNNVSGGLRKRIDLMTQAISRSTAPTDVWLQRGTSIRSLGSLFGVSENQILEASKYGDEAIMSVLTSNSDYGQDRAFLSCGSSKGQGFDGKVRLNIYCPKGTQMIYAEPFSRFGKGGKKSWDGESGQNYFSDEDETILQRGTKLVPTKVSQKNGVIYVDVDVIGQDYNEV